VLQWGLAPEDEGLSAWADLGRVLAQAARSAAVPREAGREGPFAAVISDERGDRLVFLPGDAGGETEGTWEGPEGAIPLGRLSTEGGSEVPLPGVSAPSVATVRLGSGAPITYLAGARLAGPGMSGDRARVEAATLRPTPTPAEVGGRVPGSERREREPLAVLFLLLAAFLLPIDVGLHRRASAT
jgi:hypothetical protein